MEDGPWEGAILMRFGLSLIAFVGALMSFSGVAVAADYRIIWHGPDLVSTVDDRSLRETPEGTRIAETVDLHRVQDHITAYRHRIEVDCAGVRMRTIGAWQTPMTDESAYARLDAAAIPARTQGWVAPVPGNASDYFFRYMCRPELKPGADRSVVRDSSPSEVVKAHARQWFQRHDALPDARWTSWRVAFDDMGLPDYRPAWRSWGEALGLIGGVVAALFLAHWAIKKLRPPSIGEARVPASSILFVLLALSVGGATLWGFATSPSSGLKLLIPGLFFFGAGLAMTPSSIWWRLRYDREGFSFRNAWGRTASWRWTNVRAVEANGMIRERYRLAMVDGAVVELPAQLEGMGHFISTLEAAKGWQAGSILAELDEDDGA